MPRNTIRTWSGVNVSNFLALPGTRSTSEATFLVSRPSATSWPSTCESAPSIAGACAPCLASSTPRPGQVAATQLHNQIIDVSARQILNRKGTELALHRLQDVLVACCGCRSNLVAGTQPVSARLVDGKCRRLHIRPRSHLPLYIG
jgi:hypothetical protein